MDVGILSDTKDIELHIPKLLSNEDFHQNIAVIASAVNTTYPFSYQTPSPVLTHEAEFPQRQDREDRGAYMMRVLATLVRYFATCLITGCMIRLQECLGER